MTDKDKVIDWILDNIIDESLANELLSAEDLKSAITSNIEELRQYPGWSSIESTVYAAPATENLDKLAKQYDKFEDIPETYFYNLAEDAKMTPEDAKAYILKAMKKQSEKIDEKQKLADEYRHSKESGGIPYAGTWLENEYAKADRLKGETR